MQTNDIYNVRLVARAPRREGLRNATSAPFKRQSIYNTPDIDGTMVRRKEEYFLYLVCRHDDVL